MNNPESHFKSWTVAGVIVLAMAAAIFFARPAYRHFKEKHSLARAEAFFKQGDYRSAALSARQTLLVNSNNVAACHIMADISDIIHSPAALDWRTRIVDIDPSVENKLLLAEAGLVCQNPPYPLTAQMLGAVSRRPAACRSFRRCRRNWP